MVAGGREPRVPVERRGDVLADRVGEDVALVLVPAARHVHVDAHELDVLHEARPDVLLELVVLDRRVALVAHLRDDAVLRRRLHEKVALLEGVGERLLDVDRLAELHRVHRRGEVREVGDRDEHRVDPVGHLVEHLAEVPVARQVRIRLDGRQRRLRAHVGVAQGDKFADVRRVLAELLDVVPRLLSDADRREAHLAVGRVGLRREGPRHQRRRARRERRLEKSPTIHVRAPSP